MRSTLRLCVFLLIFAFAGKAHADEVFSFQITSGHYAQPFVATGVFTGHYDPTYADDPAYDGLFLVTKLTGGRYNDTPLTLVPAAPNVTPIGSTFVPGFFGAGIYIDDILFPSATGSTNEHYLIDNAGFLFKEGATYFNLYYVGTDGTGYEVAFPEGDFQFATLSIRDLGATPEPSGVVMMTTGAAALIGWLWLRRGKSAA